MLRRPGIGSFGGGDAMGRDERFIRLGLGDLGRVRSPGRDAAAAVDDHQGAGGGTHLLDFR